MITGRIRYLYRIYSTNKKKNTSDVYGITETYVKPWQYILPWRSSATHSNICQQLWDSSTIVGTSRSKQAVTVLLTYISPLNSS